RPIRRAMLVDGQPNKERELDCGRVKPNEVECRDSVAEQFQQCCAGSQSCGPEMDWQKRAMQKPRGNCSRADEHACVSGEQHSKSRGANNEQRGENAKNLVKSACKDVMSMKFEQGQTWKNARAKRRQNPHAHRHG